MPFFFSYLTFFYRCLLDILGLPYPEQRSVSCSTFFLFILWITLVFFPIIILLNYTWFYNIIKIYRSFHRNFLYSCLLAWCLLCPCGYPSIYNWNLPFLILPTDRQLYSAEVLYSVLIFFSLMLLDTFYLFVQNP